METILAVVIGVLFASGLYMMLRRSIVKLVIGLSLLGHAANLLIFTVAGLTRETAPLVPEGMKQPPEPFADPVPQALILTAIVIGFAMIAFALALAKMAHARVGSDDVDDFRTTDT